MEKAFFRYVYSWKVSTVTASQKNPPFGQAFMVGWILVYSGKIWNMKKNVLVGACLW